MHKEHQSLSGSASLDTDQKVHIVNSLMEQGRIEVRELQDAVFKLTYLVVPAFVIVAGLFIEHNDRKPALTFGVIYILTVYVTCFMIFRAWLKVARACLQIRESFYKHPLLFHTEPFEPIRPICPEDRNNPWFQDNALWLPFGITVGSAILLLCMMWRTV